MLILPGRSGVIALPGTLETGVKRTSMSARQTLVRMTAPVLTTVANLPASV